MPFNPEYTNALSSPINTAKQVLTLRDYAIYENQMNRFQNRGKQGTGGQGICIKDPWTKPKGGRIEGGRWEWVGWR